LASAISARSAVIVVLVVAPLKADNWPAWRGPSANGISRETNLPVRWSKTENIAWWARDIQKDYGRFGLNWGYASSPLLHDDSLYVQVLHGMRTNDPSYTLSSPAISEGQIFIRTESALYAIGRRTARP
jgi:hypothetical protein